MSPTCPRCGSRSLRFSNRQTLWDRILGIFGYCAVRCRDCNHRFREGILWLPGMGFARCPKCLREDLCDWEERYYYPPRWQQALLSFGAKAHRCGACRVNFVSFKRRQREFEPSWRNRKPGGAEAKAGPPPPPDQQQPPSQPPPGEDPPSTVDTGIRTGRTNRGLQEAPRLRQTTL